MSKDHPADQPLVEDGAEAFRKFQDFTRRILAVPKKEIDRKLALEKSHKKKGKR